MALSKPWGQAEMVRMMCDGERVGADETADGTAEGQAVGEQR